MFDDLLKTKRSDKDPAGQNVREMDINYIKMAYELEKLRTVNRKIDTINTKLRAFEDAASTNGFDLKPQTMSIKTKEAIKLILQKHSELTSSDLSKLIKLSRTRCNEYLREMQNEGILLSKTNCRKRLYSLRH